MPTESYPCPKGRYSAFTLDGSYTGARSNLNTSCAECPQGKYAEAEESTACTDCAAGYELPFEGSSTQGDCSPCGVGEHSNAAGTGSCAACASGTYTSETATVTCTTCPEGTWTLGADSASTCEVCDDGQFGVNCQYACGEEPGSYVCRKKGTALGGYCLRASPIDQVVKDGWTALGLDYERYIETPAGTLYWSNKGPADVDPTTAGVCVCGGIYYDENCSTRQNIAMSFTVGLLTLLFVFALFWLCVLRRRDASAEKRASPCQRSVQAAIEYLCSPSCKRLARDAYQRVTAVLPPFSLARCAVLAGDVIERRVRKAQCDDLLLSRYQVADHQDATGISLAEPPPRVTTTARPAALRAR